MGFSGTDDKHGAESGVLDALLGTNTAVLS